MQVWFRRRFLFWLLPAVLLFAQQAALAHVVSHFSDNPPSTGKALAHLKLCDSCLAVEKLLHAPGIKEHKVIVLHGSYATAPDLPAALTSVDALEPSCRDPPTTL